MSGDAIMKIESQEKSIKQNDHDLSQVLDSDYRGSCQHAWLRSSCRYPNSK